MLICRFVITFFGYYENKFTCCNAQKNALVSHISSCLFKAPLLNTQSALTVRLTHT